MSEHAIFSDDKRLVQLWFLSGDGVYLIVEHATGVEYSNQTGGIACAHPKFEGYLVPVNESGREELSMLTANDWDTKPFGSASLRYINVFILLNTLSDRFGFEPWTDFAGACGEAWIPVVWHCIDEDIGPDYPSKGRGIITFSNSD